MDRQCDFPFFHLMAICQSLDRTQTWVDSVGADESIRSHSPKLRPAWLGRRMTPEPFLDDELP